MKKKNPRAVAIEAHKILEHWKFCVGLLGCSIHEPIHEFSDLCFLVVQ